MKLDEIINTVEKLEGCYDPDRFGYKFRIKTPIAILSVRVSQEALHYERASKIISISTGIPEENITKWI